MYKPLTRILAATCSALVLGLLTACSHAADNQLDQPVSADIMHKLEMASAASLNIKEIPLYTSLQAIQGPNLGTDAKKVGLLYVGADFCPYCAALRWPLIISLLHFGTLDGLHTMRSSPTDVYPDTTTFNFAKASYKSDYLYFQAVETADRKGKPLESLVGKADELFRKYDSPPYTTQPGGIPFFYIGGRWLLLGSPIDPQTLGTTDWSKLATELADPQSKLAKAVLPQANLITAAICDTNGGKPEKVCKAPGIVAAATLLPPR